MYINFSAEIATSAKVAKSDVCFRKSKLVMGENLTPYLIKGKQVAIEGHLQQQRWEKDGQKFSKIVIIADNVELCGGREGNGQSAPAPQQSAPQQYAPQTSAPEYSQPTLGDEFPEDIPF